MYDQTINKFNTFENENCLNQQFQDKNTPIQVP